MIITTKLSIDMQNNVPRPVISAVQNDSNSRAIEFLFYSGCTPWTIPDGITAALSYSKPDGTAGIYDKLPDGAAAFSISGTAISAIMAPQMLTVPGEVKAAIVLSDANSTQLSTFPFIVNVVASPNPGKIVSENYCYYTNLDAINEAINALQQAGGGSGYPTTTEITEESTDKQVPTAKAVYDYVTQNSSGSDSGGNVEKHNADPTSHADIRKCLTAANIVEAVSGDIIDLDDSSNMALAGLKIFGKTIQNGNPTPNAPVPLESVGDDGSVNVTVCGRNLLTNRLEENGGTSRHGLTLTLNPDGSLHVVGTATVTANVGFYLAKPIKQGERVYILCDGYKDCRFFGKDKDGNYTYSNLTPSGWYVVDNLNNADSFVADRMVIRVTSGETVDITVYLMVSTESGVYEAPKEAQSLVVSTPEGLHGISVDSGGNYTDDNGQQWVCDEVDFEKGQYIQRIGRIDSYANESVSGAYMSTTGELSAGATVLYVLYKENLVPLSAEERDRYAALHTYYPSTTIYNDADAVMGLTYVADTKLYIEKNSEGPKKLLNDLLTSADGTPYETPKQAIDSSVLQANAIVALNGSVINVDTRTKTARFVGSGFGGTDYTHQLISVYSRDKSYNLGLYFNTAELSVDSNRASMTYINVINETFNVADLAAYKYTQGDILLFGYYYGTVFPLSLSIMNITVNGEKLVDMAPVKATTINDMFYGLTNNTETFKIVLGGDSITHGVGGTGWAQNGELIIDTGSRAWHKSPDSYCWAALFKSYIESNFNATVNNQACTGTDSRFWNTYKTTLIPDDTDLFILTIGTNDRNYSAGAKETREKQLSGYESNLRSIVKYCQDKGIKILLCSPIPAGYQNEEETHHLASCFELNNVVQKVCAEFKMEFISMYNEIFYHVMDNGLDYTALLPDTVHPNDQLYKIMFYKLLRAMHLAPHYADMKDEDYPTEKWVFTMADGSVVERDVVVR